MKSFKSICKNSERFHYGRTVWGKIAEWKRTIYQVVILGKSSSRNIIFWLTFRTHCWLSFGILNITSIIPMSVVYLQENKTKPSSLGIWLSLLLADKNIALIILHDLCFNTQACNIKSSTLPQVFYSTSISNLRNYSTKPFLASDKHYYHK